MKFILIFFISLFLISCGGGSGTGDIGSIVSLKQGDTSSTRLQLEIVSSDACISEKYAPLSKVDAFFHNASGEVIATATSDEKGKFDVEWPKNASILSLAYNQEFKFNGKDYSNKVIQTYLSADPSLFKRVAMDILVAGSIECDKKQITVDWNDFYRQNPGYLSRTGLSPTQDKALQIPLYGKANASGNYPKSLLSIVKGTESRAAEIDLNLYANNEKIAPQITDFKKLGRTINLSAQTNFGEIMFGVANLSESLFLSYKHGEKIFAFDDDNYPNMAIASYSYNDSNSRYSLIQSLVLPKGSSTLNLDATSHRQQLIDSLQSYFLVGGNSKYQLNFAPNLQGMSVSTFLPLVQKQYKITITGPAVGELPNLRFPKVYEDYLRAARTSEERLAFNIFGSAHSNDYKDFLGWKLVESFSNSDLSKLNRYKETLTVSGKKPIFMP